MILKIRKSNNQNIIGGFYQGQGGYGSLKLFDGIDNDMNDPLVSLSASTAIPTFFNGGNVGIGTSTPSDRLHIYEGNLLFSGLLYPAIITGNGVTALNIHSNADPFEAGLGSSTIPRAIYDFNTTSESGFTMTSSHFNVTGDLIIDDVFRAAADPSGISYINSGNFGIGTTTPEAKLQVYGGDIATSTVEIGGSASSKGSCLKLRDSDGAGWTYCTTLDGTLNCSTTSCE
jgi:hypothetical protein